MRRIALKIGIFSSIVFLLLIPTPYFSQAYGRQSAPLVQFSPDPSMPLPSIQPAIPISSAKPTPVSGVQRVLIIAATFLDFNNTKSVADLKHIFFGEVNGYYKEISYGGVSLQGDVLGWYKLNYVKAYYGRDCTAIDDTNCNGQPASWYFARDALVAAQKDVNLTNYDYYLFVHAGAGEESSRVTDDMWSVTYLGGIWITSKPGSLNRFAILPELEAKGASPMGVYAHEFGHLLGLPDLYDSSTGKSIMGPWSLMDKGLWNGNPPGTSPSHMEAWSKIYLGWINNSSLGIARSNSFTNFTVDPAEVTSNGVHAIEVPVSKDSPASQYYLIEVREKLGFDSGLPATGVLITYVNLKAFTSKVTVVDGHPHVAGLLNATWSVGQIFLDNQDNIAIAITGRSADSYQVSVNRLGPMPDLSITNMYAQPTTIKPNTTVTVFVDIANQGTLGASNVPVQVTLDGQPFANMQVTLAEGSTTELALTWKAVAGTHQFQVVIDPLDTLTELSKANNIAALTLNVGPTLIITVPLNVAIGNATAWVKVNGVLCYANGSAQVTTSIVPGTVTVEVESTVPTLPGTRQSFAAWSDGNLANPRQIIVNSDTSLSAVYKTQYLLTIDRNGGVTTLGGWFDPNASVTITATSPSNVTQQKSRLVFTNWSGDANSTAPSLLLVLNRPIAVKANWKAQYYLAVLSTVGGPSGSGWYDAGATATIAVQSPVEFQNNTRYVFVGWNGIAQAQGPTGKVVVSSPTIVSVQWKNQYLVQINSPYGNPQGAGWYDAGTNVQISITPQVDQGNRTRRVFDGWSGDYSGNDPVITLNLTSPRIVTAKWATQYELVFKASGIPNSTVLKLSPGSVSGEISINNEYRDWFNQSQQINPTTNQTIVNGFMIYQFADWENSTGAIVKTPLTVDGPQDYTAVYTTTAFLPAIPGFPWESILVGVMLGLLLIAFAGTGKQKHAERSDDDSTAIICHALERKLLELMPIVRLHVQAPLLFAVHLGDVSSPCLC